MGTPLPRDEDGRIVTSAEFGESHIVRIVWTTDHDGRHIDPGKEEYPETFHGPFETQAEAKEWLEAYPEFTDIEDMFVIPLNSVRTWRRGVS